ncbi:hypothetical protein [Robertmurraya siralis]|uniref:hypothetical protein n=1 Tax=Robertmurraya siralis TaxID=77777 RepID=UPI000BA6A3CC|nr:hypothetical protein [Robertmurraya siralis]PAE21983.1 hypothetical protein CHH80_03555 [Bacillus sp. 7504-2]
MKLRQRKKILKRSGYKLHQEMTLTSLELKVCDREVESKFTSALHYFNKKEFDEGTIYKGSYIERLTNLYKDTVTIENITGVKRLVD